MFIEGVDVFPAEVDDFWVRISDSIQFSTVRSYEYLHWRYDDPLGGLFVKHIARGKDDEIIGFIVTTVKERDSGYKLGYIVDLVAEDVPTAADLVKHANRYLDMKQVNTSLALLVQGHPYRKALNQNGYFDSRFPLNLFLNPVKNKSPLEELESFSVGEVFFSYGDIYSLPTSF